MKFNLLPKTNVFFLFLKNLSLKAEEAAGAFKRLIFSDLSARHEYQKIRDIEHEGDQIVHQIMVKLNKTFITPIDREDIQQLVKKIDDLIDKIHALSERIFLFQIKNIRDDLKQMVAVLEQAIEAVVSVISKIESLKDPQKIFDICIQIHTFENQGDRLFEKAIGGLFQQETNPIEVIKWKEIYDFIEGAIDQCEDIADIVWGIAVKYS